MRLGPSATHIPGTGRLRPPGGQAGGDPGGKGGPGGAEGFH